MKTETKDHAIVVAAVMFSNVLILGFFGAFKSVRWLWRMLLHVTYYQQGPGKVACREKGIATLMWDDINLAFTVSNPIFAAKQRLTHVEAARLIQSIRSLDNELEPTAIRWDRLMPKMRLIWKGQPYRAWQVPALNLRRRPDDVTLNSELRWQPTT